MHTDKTPHQSLAGRRILLSGGTTGIGRATLLALAREGARLLTFAREQAPLDEALAEAELDPDCGLVADAGAVRSVGQYVEAC